MNKRRTLIVVLGLLIMPFDLAAQPARVPRLGLLFGNDPALSSNHFEKALRDLGYVEGKNIYFERRAAAGNQSVLPALAAELVRLNVDIIVAFQTPAVRAAKDATTRIPIVMASAGDPVATGLVASLARPGGNITGRSSETAELAAKTLELIREIRPATKRVAVMANGDETFTRRFFEVLQAAARSMKIELNAVMIHGGQGFDAAFAKWGSERVDAVIIQPSIPARHAIELAAKHRLIIISPTRGFAEAGGLLSYSASPEETFQRVAVFVDKILRGAKPADLPVEQATKFELVINMKNATTLGVNIPQSLLVRADKVIE